MNKIKRIIISSGTFIVGSASKVFAAPIQSKYGVFKPEPTIGEKILGVGKIVVPVILFIIGIFIMLSKKITKKAKKIIIFVIAILVIIGIILVNNL